MICIGPRMPWKSCATRRAVTLVAPFASITWSRFYGSAALPRDTLSLCPLRTGRLPVIESTLGRRAESVKRFAARDL
jgi:hypothetical protein